MNIFIDAPINKTGREERRLPLLKEYGFNFEKDEFLKDENGQHVIVTKNEALKVWIYKVLKTERWRFLAYHNEYGAELEQFIGQPNTAVTGERMKLYIKEALLVNPYIVSIDKIHIQYMVGDEIAISVYLTSMYGHMHQEVTIRA